MSLGDEERDLGVYTYFDISRVDTVIPLHNKTMRPVRATATRNRVRVKNINTAFQGGNLALADFQLTPPLGSSMMVVVPEEKKIYNRRWKATQKEAERPHKEEEESAVASVDG